MLGPRVSVELRAGGRTLGSGSQAAGWDGQVVTVPLSRALPTSAPATVCFSFGSLPEGVTLLGAPTTLAPARSAEHVLPGRLRVEYLRPGRRSWWSLAPSIARRIGLSSFAAGGGIALVALLLTAAAIAVGSIWAVREPS
jgi:hypothetical protein